MNRFFATLYDVAFFARETVAKNVAANVYKILVKNGYKVNKNELYKELVDDIFSLLKISGGANYTVSLSGPIPFWDFKLTKDLKVVSDRGVLGDASKPMVKKNEPIEELLDPYFDDLRMELSERVGRAIKTKVSNSGLYVLDLANLVTRYPGKKFRAAVVKIADGDVYIEFFDKQFYAKYEIFTDKGVLVDKRNGATGKISFWDELVMLAEHFHDNR